MPLIFPTHLFNPANIKISLQGATIVSQPSLSGVGQVLRTDGGGFWVCEMSGIVLRTPEHVRGWRAWETELAGGVERIVVPVADIRYAPLAYAGKRIAKPVQVRTTDVDPFFPASGPYGPNRAIVATVGAAAFRATQLIVTIAKGAPVQSGSTFSINHPTKGRRMYRVGRILSRNGMSATFNSEPPLREAVNTGTAVDFEWPSFTAIQVPQIDISPDLATYGRGEVSIQFREAL